MPDLDLKLLAERVGCPPTATPEQIIQKTYSMAEALEQMEKGPDGRDYWRNKAEVVMAENVQLKKRDEDMKTKESSLFVEEAISKHYLDAAEREDFIALHKLDPDRVKKIVDGRRNRAYLATEFGFSGGDQKPISALAEVDSRVAEIRARDPKVSHAMARVQVLNEDKTLANRYRLEHVSGAKDGDQ